MSAEALQTRGGKMAEMYDRRIREVVEADATLCGIA